MCRFKQLPDYQPKILVVDDRPDNVELLSVILISQGYQVEECDRGMSAIELARSNPPDLILLDISMPEMDGFEVCQILKGDILTQEIPIVFLSALKDIDDKTQAFKIGGSDYITKPFQIAEVVVRVESQLKHYNLQAELKAKNIKLEQEIKARQAAEAKLLKLNQKLNTLATLDGLTNIANRFCFENFLAQEWLRGKREKFPLSFILCDVDYFKLYNDYFGHQAGDICLKSVAQAISDTIQRPADLVARYGGEEFAVILPHTPAENALQVAEKIRLAVQDLCILHPSSLVRNYVSLSLGVTSIIPDSKYSRNQLLMTADKALYQAKKGGRDRAVFRSIF